jgi:hypothetical protein
LICLPLSPEVWGSVARYANATLTAEQGQSARERCAVINATPWIPFESVRETVSRLGRGELDNDSVVRLAASDVAREMSKNLAIDRNWSPTDPVGFTWLSQNQRQQLSTALAELSDDQLWVELRTQTGVSDPRAALIVTVLTERSSRTTDVESGYQLICWVEGQGSDFRPDLQGLFGVFWRLRKERMSPSRVEMTFMSWQVAWLVSRGGVIPLLAGLDVQLNSPDHEERSAAISLIQYAGAFVGSRSAPSYGVGVGVDPIDPRPGVPPRTELLDESELAAGAHLDDDVQFTVYRPNRVQPDRWYPLLAFAHRTEPIESPTGDLMNPIDEVARQAASLLADSPGSFDLVRADSEVGLLRGTDLLFEPWVDTGEFNPAQASVRWEEPIHRVEFRLRVPSSSDGRRLSGGLRVFVGPLLIGEVLFQLPVSATATTANAATTHESAKRFRQIFASYSHRDIEVVEEVERYVTLTGDRYMIDVKTLRSGEIWDERLRELIDAADIFQLFWSRNAMYSPYVRQEWEYALQLSREGFVRPVYWEEPLPEDPQHDLPTSELRKLHFSRVQAQPTTSTTTDHQIPDHTTTPPTATTSPSSPSPPSLRPQAPTRPEAKASRVPPSRDLQQGDLVCSVCGQGNNPARRFCARCGTSLENTQAVREKWSHHSVGHRSRRRPRISWIVGAVIAVALVVAVALLL